MRNESLPDDKINEDLDRLEDNEPVEDSIIEVVESARLPPDIPFYHLRFACSRETFLAVYKGEILEPQSQVIVMTRYGRDLAVVVRQVKCDNRKPLKFTEIERPAAEEDLERAENNRRYEEKAFDECREIIAGYRLNMKLIAVHFLLEEGKMVVFYTAPDRVDFRELVKELAAYFKTRVQMRQIGYRDDSRIHGGIGVCGREFCCHFNKLKKITVNMAKDQKLSLNMNKISGPCERLLCCIGYEHEHYLEKLKFMPPEGYKITHEGALWKVIEVNVICGMVTLGAEDGRKITLPKNQFEKSDSRWFIKPAGKTKADRGM